MWNPEEHEDLGRMMHGKKKMSQYAADLCLADAVFQ